METWSYFLKGHTMVMGLALLDYIMICGADYILLRAKEFLAYRPRNNETGTRLHIFKSSDQCSSGRRTADILVLRSVRIRTSYQHLKPKPTEQVTAQIHTNWFNYLGRFFFSFKQNSSFQIMNEHGLLKL